MARILIFTGKGGVGKTSVAAAHARLSAQEGKRTLLVSTDMAHNLGDLFQMPVGHSVVTVADRLDALEIDPNRAMDHDFPDMTRAMGNLLGSLGMPEDNAWDLNAFPGMDELFSLLKLLGLHESGIYDRIIVDCAPTGETLALLKFPELLSWYMEKFFPVGKVAMRVLSPISRTVFKVQLPDKHAMTDIEHMYLRLSQLQQLLKDRATTSIRLVAMPEKMVVEETKRSYMYMNLYDYQVDDLYINRILPPDMDNPFFSEWLGIQQQYLDELDAVFSGMPIHRIPWFDSDLNGLAGIDRLVDATLAGKDVFSITEAVHGERYEQTENGWRMSLFLPGAARDAVVLHETGTDLVVRIGNFKRSIPLPGALRHHRAVRARFEDTQLRIDLEKVPG